MRELEPRFATSRGDAFGLRQRVTVVGAGRVGTVLAAALSRAGVPVTGPLTRDDVGDGLPARARQGGPSTAPAASTASDASTAPDASTAAEVVLLCVPDAAIPDVAAQVPLGPFVGHCSGATGLDVLAPHEAFSLHPLMTVSVGAPATVLSGAGAAIAGSSPAAMEVATRLATVVGLVPVAIADADRAAYHAAATMAANFLVTLEGAAERLAATAGLERAQLVPLVHMAVENWARTGAHRALTGPVARGDEATVERQRGAVAERVPELLALFDALTDATRALAAREAAVA